MQGQAQGHSHRPSERESRLKNHLVLCFVSFLLNFSWICQLESHCLLICVYCYFSYLRCGFFFAHCTPHNSGSQCCRPSAICKQRAWMDFDLLEVFAIKLNSTVADISWISHGHKTSQWNTVCPLFGCHFKLSRPRPYRILKHFPPICNLRDNTMTLSEIKVAAFLLDN